MVFLGASGRNDPPVALQGPTKSAADAAATRCPHVQPMRNESETTHLTPAGTSSKEEDGEFRAEYSSVRVEFGPPEPDS